ncbi:MAG: NAD(P)/FAD-dependent oxidoreductase [Actinomycetota bacterium]
MKSSADAVVIGSGPNGLVAACLLAQQGWSVQVLEGADVPGGAVRTEESTLPGFKHDCYSAFYAMLHASPVFQELGLDKRIEWANFEIPVAAAVTPEDVGFGFSDVEQTCSRLSLTDGAAWSAMYQWWIKSGRHFLATMLGPIPSIGPSLQFLRSGGIFGTTKASRMFLQPMRHVATRRFSADSAQVLLAGGATHTDLPIEKRGSTPPALILAMVAQELGMPIPIGGAGKITDALVSILEEAGGSIATGHEVKGVLVERGRAVGVTTSDGTRVMARRAVLANTGPKRLFLDMVPDGDVPSRYLKGIKRFRYTSGMYRLDLALDKQVQWTTSELAKAGVIHLTGNLEQMTRSQNEVATGVLPKRPNLIIGQQSIADPSRAPNGKHSLWIETQVPPTADFERFPELVLDEIERHAPGTKDSVLATHIRTPADLEAENPNLVHGDPGGGSLSLNQQLVLRPVPGWFRYRTPVKSLYLCSASAHPGGGVHGMVGRNCAERVLRDRIKLINV